MVARSLFALVLLTSLSCGKPETTAGTGFIAGFEPTAPLPGSVRFVTPAIHDIPPGGDVLFCQYLSGPSQKAQDVTLITGVQSKGGHHVVAYATQVPLPVGTSRPCTANDQLNLSFLGGIGQEGVGNLFAQMPQGVTFRLPAGYGIMVNAHYINTGTETMDGQSVLDVQFADPSTTRQPLNLFPNVSTQFTIPVASGSTTPWATDVYCPVGAPVQMILFANHEHEWGTSMYSEVIHTDNTTTLIRADDPWQYEFTFNPTFEVYPLTGPKTMILQPGDRVHTHCEWLNTTDTPLVFPVEMCVGVGLILGDHEIDCTDGQWDSNNGNAH